jgi:hypothetical protein
MSSLPRIAIRVGSCAVVEPMIVEVEGGAKVKAKWAWAEWIERRFSAAHQVQWALVRIAMKCESESKCGCESMESGEGKEGGGQTKTQLFSFLPLRPSTGLGRMTRIRKLHARDANKLLYLP